MTSTNPEDAWLITRSGVKFYPANPNTDDISIFDIAHALSFICRYAGHCSKFYSVADHSNRLCEMAPDELKPYALMHDAAEAYLLDVPLKLKDTIFQGYRKVEDALLNLILDKFDISPVSANDRAKVKKLEYKLLATEVRDLMNTGGEGWYLPEEPLVSKLLPNTPEFTRLDFIGNFFAYVMKRTDPSEVARQITDGLIKE